VRVRRTAAPAETMESMQGLTGKAGCRICTHRDGIVKGTGMRLPARTWPHRRDGGTPTGAACRAHQPVAPVAPVFRRGVGGSDVTSAPVQMPSRRAARQARDLEQHRAKLEQELEREVRDPANCRNRASPVRRRGPLADSMLRSAQSGQTAGPA